MELRITRPELYLDCAEPTDVKRRQGYYSQGRTEEDCVIHFFNNNKEITTGEVIDVQIDKFSSCHASYRKNSEGEIIKLPHSLMALDMLEKVLSMFEPMEYELSDDDRDDLKVINADCADIRSGVDV